jgi:ABC-2 type transport system permease protein
VNSGTWQDEPELQLVNAPALMWRGTLRDVRDVWRARELLFAFTGRELRTRYKGASLGWAWALVRPLVMLLVYGLAVGIFLGAGKIIPQFMIFIYSGLLAWTLFATIVNGSILSLVANGPLVGRSSFPRLLLPLSVALAALVDFLLQLCVILVGYAIYRDVPSPRALLWLPPALFVLVCFALGIGLALAAANVYIRDVGFLTDVALQVGFWLAPILYSYGQVAVGAEQFGLRVDVVTRIFMLNPMANVVLAFQRALWPAANDQNAQFLSFPGELGLRLAVFAALGVVTLWIGSRIFSRLSADFGQEL